MIRTLLTLLPQRGRVTAHLGLTLLSVALRAVSAVLLVPLVAALFGPDPERAWPWMALLAAAIAAGWAVDWAVTAIGFDLGFALLDTGQHQVADQVARTRLTWFDAANTATARQAIASTGPDLVGLVIYLVTPLLSAVALPVAIALALLAVSWQLALAALVGIPVLLGAYWASGRIGRAADRAAARANSALTERLVEFARTQHALRAARRVDPERSEVGAALDRQHGATVRLLTMQVPGQILFSVASQLALLLLAGTTVALAANGDLTAPEAVALIVVIVRYLEPFTALAELSGGVESTVGALRRIRTVLQAPRTGSGTARAAATGSARVELRGVGFRYAPADPPVLDGFDLTLEAGTATAIVGPSGSGKSTVLALLAGLHEPTSGRILVNGEDTAELTADDRRSLVSMVFQHPYLFDGTIRENLLTDAGDVDEAARLARVDTIVRRLPDGWDTRVGEAGTALSGGERQRVSIARALLKPAPLLLVDEATSALDTENEAAVAAAVAADRLGRTRVIVAHRLASIRHVDRVVFIEEGRIVEDGPVDELLDAGGRFAEFWRRQDAAADWRLGTKT
ncbi:ABC transporter ATP-binding protein [Glycomyces sp. NRRL B-16210]|uniref:ABC transporter ATP-binding protein n=1 Tax=Glycomyces sp. NRRL B-16210 TaxID=1463821 RepID=UPI0004C0C137|nr:ABC transporter ATP-binding protein [Glycomyces sp. NRRL B-16210]